LILILAAANGVVIATEKKLPSILVDETSVSLFSAISSLFIHYSRKKIVKLSYPNIQYSKILGDPTGGLYMVLTTSITLFVHLK